MQRIRFSESYFSNKKRERIMLPFIILTAHKNCPMRAEAHYALAQTYSVGELWQRELMIQPIELQ